MANETGVKDKSNTSFLHVDKSAVTQLKNNPDVSRIRLGFETEEGTKFGTMFYGTKGLKQDPKHESQLILPESSSKEFDVNFGTKDNPQHEKMTLGDIVKQNKAYQRAKRTRALEDKVSDMEASVQAETQMGE